MAPKFLQVVRFIFSERHELVCGQCHCTTHPHFLGESEDCLPQSVLEWASETLESSQDQIHTWNNYRHTESSESHKRIKTAFKAGALTLRLGKEV